MTHPRRSTESIMRRQNELLRKKSAREAIVREGGQEWTDDAGNLRILLSSAVCECRTKFDGHPWCGRHRRLALYMPTSPRLPTFPSGKLVMHTDSDDNDEPRTAQPPPLMADSDQELSPRSSSDHD
jgi:hypothetical protein